MTFTKEWLQKAISDIETMRDEIPFGLDEDGNNTLQALKMALAGMEAEPVAMRWRYLADGIHEAGEWNYRNQNHIDELNSHSISRQCELLYAATQPLTTSERAELENYRNAQQEVNYQHLSELYHAQEKRLFKLAQRIKGPAFDKYAHSTSQAIDVLESAVFGESEDACRAAMLNHSGDTANMVEPVSETYKLPPNSFTNEDLEGMAHGNNPVANAYRELLALQRNSPVIPDGWVACSERMPEEDGNYWGWWSESKRQGPVWFIKSELQAQFQSSEVTHWMPLPAAPQQEVK